MKNQSKSLLCLSGILAGSLFLSVSLEKQIALAGGCNSGLGKLDPTCPGRIFNPPPNSGSDFAVEPPHRRVYEFNGNAYYVYGNNFCHIPTPQLHTFLANKYGVTYTSFSTQYKTSQGVCSTNQSKY
jgi:hypothetical protein